MLHWDGKESEIKVTSINVLSYSCILIIISVGVAPLPCRKGSFLPHAVSTHLSLKPTDSRLGEDRKGFRGSLTESLISL